MKELKRKITKIFHFYCICCAAVLTAWMVVTVPRVVSQTKTRVVSFYTGVIEDVSIALK